MAGIRSAREEYLAANGNTTYLSNEELVSKKTEFCIISAEKKATPKFGDAWWLSIVYLDEQGQHVEQTLFLSPKDRKSVV